MKVLLRDTVPSDISTLHNVHSEFFQLSLYKVFNVEGYQTVPLQSSVFRTLVLGR